MKTVFNIFIAAVAIWVLWTCVFGRKVKNSAEPVASTQYEQFRGVRTVKSCVNYFSRPTSVVMDNDHDCLYVSCLNDADHDIPYPGYVCKVSLYGEILDTLPVPELREPRGMAVHGGRLYIADKNRVVRMDTETEVVDLLYRMPKAMFLSDVVDDRDGNIYVSDTHAGCIYRLQGDSCVVLCSDSLLCNVTGLCISSDNMLVAGAKNAVLQVDAGGSINVLANVGFSVYGIRDDGNGNFLASDLSGNLHYIAGGKSTVLQKKQGNANTADFEYLLHRNMIYMPTYLDNSLLLMETGILQ